MKILAAIFASCCLVVGSAFAGNVHQLGVQVIPPDDHRCYGYLPDDHGPADLDNDYNMQCRVMSTERSRFGVEISGQATVDGPITLNGGTVDRLRDSNYNRLMIRNVTFKNNSDLVCFRNGSHTTPIKIACLLHDK